MKRKNILLRPRIQKCRIPDRLQHPGPASYEEESPHPGLSRGPESLRGSAIADLTLGITLGRLRDRSGFTDLSRILDEITPVPGSLIYPTRNFATLGPFVGCYRDPRG